MCYSAAVSCSYACVDHLLQTLRDHTTMYYIVRLITLGVYVYMCSRKRAIILLLSIIVAHISVAVSLKALHDHSI
jgi:hypothetical protein